MESKKPSEEDDFEFNWIQARKDAGLGAEEYNEETGIAKLKRKFNENPLVPIGCVLTATCLALGLMSFRAGNKEMSQTMMRARVLAQGFTVAALISGICFKAAQE